ncbi:NAD(P)/FAD-dependent oxidoreductase [Lapillicoccus sp.]|uniref:phytoene desaturase family protein n=1 Tax=Lapillicoccus sp. TaxID=1909287 RepID=UPI003264F287
MADGTSTYDDIVVGAGHNGLTAAAYLARAGRRVLVLERRDHTGGAAVSERPFPGVDARVSRYSYLVSLLPRRIVEDLDLDLRLVRRRVSSYTPNPVEPTTGLLVDTGDLEATRASFRRVTGGDADFDAWQRFYARMGEIAGRVWPTFLEPLVDAEAMRATAADDELWAALTTAPLGELLRATFSDDLVRGVVATDGLIGTFADVDGPDLAANICFLYHLVGRGTGDWDVPVGGMGAVTDALARAATDAGAEIVPGVDVSSVSGDGEVVWRRDGHGHTTRGHVHAGVAPAVLDELLAAAGSAPVSAGPRPEGSQLKVNMLLRRLPRLRDDGVAPGTAFAGTFHVRETLTELRAAYAGAESGRLPDPLPCEVYCHTLSDRSILGPALAGSDAQTLTLFGLHTPARLFEHLTDDDHAARRAEALEAALHALDSVLAESLADVLVTDANGDPCIEVRTPRDLERDLGLPGGNIFHRPLQWPWAEEPAEVGTWGVETAHPAVTLSGAGARRGGGVSGIPGHHSARSVLD